MTETPPTFPLPSKKDESKRFLAFTLAMMFLFQMATVFIEFWSHKRPLKIAGLTKSTSSWAVDFELSQADVEDKNKLEVVDKKSKIALRQEALAKTINQTAQAQEAKRLNIIPTAKEVEAMHATKIERFLSHSETDTPLARTQQQNRDLNIVTRFSRTLEELALSRKLENAIADNEVILPWEADAEAGTLYFQTLPLHYSPDDAEEIPAPSEEEIVQYYTQNIDNSYRVPNFCQVRMLAPDDEAFCPTEESSEQELTECFQEDPDAFVRPAQRCFRYAKLENQKNPKNLYKGKKDLLSESDFDRLTPLTDICSKKELPSEFAQTLFKMTPKEIVEGIFYDGGWYAVQYLFEIPEKKLSFTEAKPLVLMQQFQKNKEILRHKLYQELIYSSPLEGQALKDRIDELFERYHYKAKWKVLFPKYALHALGNFLKEGGMDEKTTHNLTLPPEANENLSSIVRYGRTSSSPNSSPIIIELSNFCSGRIIPLIEVRENITRILKAEATKEIVEKAIIEKAKKALAREENTASSTPSSKNSAIFSDELDFGEEQRLDLKPLSIQIAKYERDRKMSPHIPVEKLHWLLSALPFPTSDRPVYALVPPEYDEHASWQLIRFFKRAKLPKTFSETSQTEEVDAEIQVRLALLSEERNKNIELLGYHLLAAQMVPDEEEHGALDKASQLLSTII